MEERAWRPVSSLQNRVKAAWLRRWSNILACSAARAFALSLLDKHPNPGTGAEVPELHEVLRDIGLPEVVSVCGGRCTVCFSYLLAEKARIVQALIVQALTDQDVNATVVTVDGVGAYDLISNVRRPLEDGRGDQILPSARWFCGPHPRICGRMRWGTLRKSCREREESRATPSCQCCSLWEHPALEAIRRRLLDDEKLLAYLDDVTVVCQPDRGRQCLQLWRRNSHDVHTSASTRGRPKCGTVRESHPKALKS